jgi:hypothetical protein
MKLVLSILILSLGVSITSCKKYSRCCSYSYHDVKENKDVQGQKSCSSNLSKKEYKDYDYSNNNPAWINSQNMQGYPNLYTNVTMNCED